MNGKSIRERRKKCVELKQTVFVSSLDYYWTFSFIFQRLNSLWKMKYLLWLRVRYICLSCTNPHLLFVYIRNGDLMAFHWNHSKCSWKNIEVCSRFMIEGRSLRKDWNLQISMLLQFWNWMRFTSRLESSYFMIQVRKVNIGGIWNLDKN